MCVVSLVDYFFQHSMLSCNIFALWQSVKYCLTECRTSGTVLLIRTKTCTLYFDCCDLS